MEGIILMKWIIRLLANNYRKIRNIKLIVLLIIPILSYYYKFHYELIVVLVAMLFFIELKKWRN